MARANSSRSNQTTTKSCGSSSTKSYGSTKTKGCSSKLEAGKEAKRKKCGCKTCKCCN